MSLDYIPFHKHSGLDGPQLEPQDQNRLPVWNSVPTYKVEDGRCVLVNKSGVYNLYAYIDGGWRNLTNNT